jgi:hypothetical protein
MSLPSLLTTCYHLNKFTARNNPKNAKGTFNLKHYNLRVNAERAFDALKVDSRSFTRRHFTLTTTQVELLIA